VQIAARDWKIQAYIMRREISTGGALQQSFLRYPPVLLTQVSPDRGVQSIPLHEKEAVPPAAALP
jgi:hypothetical protein